MLLPYHVLWKVAQEQGPGFKARKPFPYICIDNFLPADLAQGLLESCPAPNSEYWKKTDNEHTFNKSVGRMVAGTALLKEVALPGLARQVLHELNSAGFLWFLHLLTGIEGLSSDPYMIEGGYHMVGNGGRLGIHADFSHHSFTHLERRLNLLLYLNEEWRDEWGGHLHLYDENLESKVNFAPIFNRAVIFETSATSFHGHPEPMRLPVGKFRRSFALYYYAAPRVEREPHKIVFPQPEEVAA